jgi:pimeloyl-ACP methyl ester carboxylesterase
MRTDVDFSVTFDGHDARHRSGRVYFATARTRGCAVFAHFLGGSTPAVSMIARQLRRAGISTLSLNLAAVEEGHPPWDVEDLVAAARFAVRSMGPVRLLVGNGIAGAALLAASTALERVEGIATIGAPHGARYARALLCASHRTVGRFSGGPDGAPALVSERFIEDLAAQEELETLGSACCSLLVIHGASDEVVPPSEALRIARAVRGRRLVALVRGDHRLLADPRSAEQVARILEAWAVALVCRPAVARGALCA